VYYTQSCLAALHLLGKGGPLRASRCIPPGCSWG